MWTPDRGYLILLRDPNEPRVLSPQQSSMSGASIDGWQSEHNPLTSVATRLFVANLVSSAFTKSCSCFFTLAACSFPLCAQRRDK